MQWIKICFLFLIFVPYQSAWASDQAENVLVGRIFEFSQKWEQRANRTLSTKITPSDYMLFISAEPDLKKFDNYANKHFKKGSVNLRSIPVKISKESHRLNIVKQLSEGDINYFVKKITVNFIVDSSYSDNSIKVFKNYIQKILPLYPKRGDVIVTKKMKMSTPTNISKTKDLERELGDLKSQLQKAQADIQTYNIREKQFQQEISSFEIKMKQLTQEALTLSVKEKQYQETVSNLNSRNEELKNETEELKKKIEEQKEELSIYNTPLGDLKKTIRGLEGPLSVYPAVIVIIIVLFVISSLFLSVRKKSLQQYMSAIQNVAEALPKIGKSGAKPQTPTSEQKQNKPSEKKVESPSAQQGMSAEEIQKKIKHCEKIWKELQNTPFCMLSIIKSWLIDEASQGELSHIVQYLDPVDAQNLLLSFDKDEIFNLFDEDSSTDIGKTFKSLLRLFLEVQRMLEELPVWYSKLSCYSFYRLKTSQLKAFTNNLSPEALSLLIYTSPSKLGNYFIDLLNDEKKELIVSYYSNVNNFAEKEVLSLNNEIESQAKSLLPQKSVDTKPILEKIYVESSADLRATLVTTLQDNEVLLNEIKGNIITIDDVFKLEKDVIQELIEPFETEEIAILAIGLEEENQRILLSLLSRRISLGVESEMKSIRSRAMTEKRAKLQSKGLQDSLSEQVRRMIRDGIIEPLDGEAA